MGGELVQATQDAVTAVGADLGAGVAERTGGIDWKAAGARAASATGGALGASLRMGGPMLLVMVADWFIDGALAMLHTKAGKPAADALAALGDAVLEVMAKALRRMIPLAMVAIGPSCRWPGPSRTSCARSWARTSRCCSSRPR